MIFYLHEWGECLLLPVGPAMLEVKGSIENNQPVSTGVIGSAISFDPTRPVYEDYEGNVGLGYYTWMNGGKPITLAAARSGTFSRLSFFWMS